MTDPQRHFLLWFAVIGACVLVWMLIDTDTKR